MASRIYPAEQPGCRYEIATKPTEAPGVMKMTIGRLQGEAVLNASLDTTSLKRIRMSGQPLPIAEGARVHYRIVSNGFATRIGYLFEFQDGPDPRSVLVGTDALEWLMGDPDCEEPYGTLR